MARGDVIFYRPANADSIEELAQGDLNEFPVLAGYAQTIPYHPTFKPWHHVALSITEDDTRAIGFTEREYQPGEQESGRSLGSALKETGGAPAAGQAADFLRPPAAIVDALVAEAERQRGTPYSAAGLMPFALITAAWMIPNEVPARDRLRTIAFGASAVARRAEPASESCTTAVAKAVKVARGSELTFTEPPIPTSSTTTEQFAASDQVKAIRALIPRLDDALRELLTSFEGRPVDEVVTELHRVGGPDVAGDRLMSFGDALEASRAGDLVDTAGIERTLGGMARDHAITLFGLDGGTDPVEAPGDDTTFPDYTGTLVGGMEVFQPGTDFEAEGEARPQPLQLQSEDYLISPAVLWDALLNAGFQQV